MREVLIQNSQGGLAEATHIQTVPADNRLVFADNLEEVFYGKDNAFIHNTVCGWIYDADGIYLGD